MIDITMYGADWCPDCRRVKGFLKEWNIPYTYQDIDADQKHVAVVERINKGKRIIPTLIIEGKSYTNPDQATLAAILGVNPAFRIIFYGADWCPDCKRTKAFLDEHQVNYQFISIDEQEWAAKEVEKLNKGKRIIPTLLINDRQLTNPDTKTLHEALGIGVAREEKVYDCVIIGAGAAGLTTAIYLQREKITTLLLEKKNVGGNTFLTKKIENYPGFKEISGPELMDRMADQAKTLGAEIKQGYEVTGIKKEGKFFQVETNLGTMKGKTLVAAVGSTYRTLNIPHENDLIGAGIHFCATCDGPFYRDKTVIVIGGGNSAVEEGIYLSELCRQVHIVHNREAFTASSVYLTKLEERKNITTHLNQESLEFAVTEHGSFKGLKIKDKNSGAENTIEADGAFVFIGLIPNTGFLKGIVSMDEKGFIQTPCGTVETSIHGFFAAGDCRQGAVAQVASATGEGVVASFAVKEYLRAN